MWRFAELPNGMASWLCVRMMIKSFPSDPKAYVCALQAEKCRPNALHAQLYPSKIPLGRKESSQQLLAGFIAMTVAQGFAGTHTLPPLPLM
jgi:hypothetical protein